MPQSYGQAMNVLTDKRTIEIKAERKGTFFSPWANNDPTIPDKATYWHVDETTDLPVIVDPVAPEQIDEMLNGLPDKDPSDARMRMELKLEFGGFPSRMRAD